MPERQKGFKSSLAIMETHEWEILDILMHTRVTCESPQCVSVANTRLSTIFSVTPGIAY